MGWSLLPAVSDAAQCSVGCVADVCVCAGGVSLGEVGGLWRCDAAGAAQCGSGEAALCFLPRSHSPSFSSLLTPPFFYSLRLLLHSPAVSHGPSPSPPPHSPVSISLQPCCSPPLLHLLDVRRARLRASVCVCVCFCTEVFSLMPLFFLMQ